MSDWINDRPVGGRPPSAAHDVRWSVVIPVKGGPDAKSRLRPPDGIDRLELARALALDTVAAAVTAVGAADVVVVTSDVEVTAAINALGATSAAEALPGGPIRVVADPGGGLNAALEAGMRAARSHGPAAVAALLGDLPALRADELRVALHAARDYPSAFVPDADGTGTVLLTAAADRVVEPRFGGPSAAAHEAAGHHRLDLDLPGLRRDVDDEQTLGGALRLGVGAGTARLLAHLIGGPP